MVPGHRGRTWLGYSDATDPLETGHRTLLDNGRVLGRRRTDDVACTSRLVRP